VTASTLATGDARSPRATAWRSRLLPAGARCALPAYALLAAGFLAPLVAIAAFSFAEPRSFGAFWSFTLANYAEIFEPSNTVWLSFAWSLALAAMTVAILVVIAYPIAYGLARLFGRWSALVSLLFVFPLFVSENIRLYGWVLFFIRGGVLDGSLGAAGLGNGPDVLYTTGATLFGMVYVYLPFMLFPITLGLSTVPQDLIEAARDLGASRVQTWREVELPLAMPGILIGMLLTFVLGVGAEAKILGGQSIIVITHDIEIAFTYAQNWPLGSALAVLLMLLVGGLTLAVIGRIDLDRMMGRR
jgi:spermidine/putrescine transport system permease protein